MCKKNGCCYTFFQTEIILLFFAFSARQERNMNHNKIKNFIGISDFFALFTHKKGSNGGIWLFVKYDEGKWKGKYGHPLFRYAHYLYTLQYKRY